MQANYVQRMRLIFSKDGPARYISHLDLARTLERALNRAEMPVSYSQGFNRRPRMAFAAPLPLGYTSEFELVDLWLEREMEPQSARVQIMSRMAPGITITDAHEVELNADSLQSQTLSANYHVRLLDELNHYDLAGRVQSLLAETSLMRMKRQGKGKEKQYDLRPLVLDLRATGIEGDPDLQMELFLMPGKSGRPDEVLYALGIDALAAHIHRTHITLQGETGDKA